MIRKSFVTGTLVCSVLFCILGVGLWWILQAPPQRGPIERTDLEQSFVGKMIEGSNWRAVDFALTAEEERNLDRCLELTKRVNAFLNGVSRFAEDDVREELESVLEAQPDFFYAEYLLGLWHDMRGNATERTRLSALALSHAPIVLEQRYFDVTPRWRAMARDRSTRAFSYASSVSLPTETARSVFLSTTRCTGAQALRFPTATTSSTRSWAGSSRGRRPGFFRMPSCGSECPEGTTGGSQNGASEPSLDAETRRKPRGRRSQRGNRRGRLQTGLFRSRTSDPSRS